MAALCYLGWEDFLKFLLESGEAETPPTGWMPLMSLTQVFFVFRSQKANNIWKDINKLVDEMVKKYTKYGWVSSSGLGTQLSRFGVHRCLYGQEHRAWGGACSEAERTDQSGSIRSQHI